MEGDNNFSVGSYTASLLNDHSEDDDLQPDILSADQNGEKSVLITQDGSGHSKASMFLSILTLVKTVIGSGILALPYTFRTMGVVMAIFFFSLSFTVTNFVGAILLKAKNLAGHSNYASIMSHIKKHRFYRYIIYLLMCLTNFGSCIVDLLLLKSSVRKVLEDIIASPENLDSFYTSTKMVILVVTVIQYPLILLNKIQRLRIFAFLGVAGVAVFIVTFFVFFIEQVSRNETTVYKPPLFPDNWFKAFATVPNIIFALAFQSNFFPIFKGLQRSNDSRMRKTILGGSLTCTLWYLIIGILGYLLAGNQLTPNYLESVPYATTNKIVYYLMNSGFLVSLFFAVPIIFFTSRNNFIAIVKIFMTDDANLNDRRAGQASDSVVQIASFVKEPNIKQRKKKAKILYVVYSTILYLALMTIAFFVDNLESVLNLVGAVGCASQAIILPCFYYRKLIQLKNKRKTYRYYLASGIFFFMLPFTVFSIAALYIPT